MEMEPWFFDDGGTAADEPTGELASLAALVKRGIAAWLVFGGVVCSALALTLISRHVQAEVAVLAYDYAQLQTRVAALGTPSGPVLALQSTLTAYQERAEQLREVHATLTAVWVDWRKVTAALMNFEPSALTICAVELEKGRLTVRGVATNEAAAVAYVRQLENSGLFKRVALQAVENLPLPPTPTPTPVPPTPTPTPTPTDTPTPTPTFTPTPTPTPTPDLRDPFEPDDAAPPAVWLPLGEGQKHNFYPDNDVDKARFLAKAGRTYRVQTSDLSPGVDTFLVVDVEGTRYTNDDRGPGDLSSEVTFQAPPDRDVEVIITVHNRGNYGPEQWYTLRVEEVVPTPTPTSQPSQGVAGKRVLARLMLQEPECVAGHFTPRVAFTVHLELNTGAQLP